MPTVNGTTYDDSTPAAVIIALENARATGRRVRLFYGDVVTGRAWTEEFDVCGRVSRSMGPKRAPLLIHNARSMGGGPILTACVVAVRHADGWGYRHPSFDVGKWEVDGDAGGAFRVAHDGGAHAAGFKSRAAAERYAAFMRGERMGR